MKNPLMLTAIAVLVTAQDLAADEIDELTADWPSDGQRGRDES